MGKATKLFVASIVSAAMVLTFALGMLPSIATPGVDAAEEGRSTVGDLLKALGLDKQTTLTALDIVGPAPGTSVKIIQNGGLNPDYAPLDVLVGATGDAQSVAVVMDGAFGDLEWSGPISADATDFGSGYWLGTLDLLGLADAGYPIDGFHDIWALGSSAAIVKADAVYDIASDPARTISVVLEERSDRDGDGNGLPDDPANDLAPGEIRFDTIETGIPDPLNPGQFIRKQVVIANLDTGSKALGDAGQIIHVQNTDGNGNTVTTTVTSPSLQDLQAAGVLDGSVTTASILIELTEDPLALLDVAPAIDPNTNLPPQGALALTQYAEVSIIYGAGNLELNALGDVVDPVTISVTGLGDLSVDGFAVYSLGTTINGSVQVVSEEDEGWSLRTGATLTADGFDIEARELSIFAPMANPLSILSLSPTEGPVGGGTTVSVLTDDGVTPFGSTLMSAITAADTYTVLFGSEQVTTFVAGGPSALVVSSPAQGFTAETAVDVRVELTDEPNAFAVLPASFTYQVPLTLTDVTPNWAPASPTVVVLTGTALDSVIGVYFIYNGGDKGAAQIVLPSVAGDTLAISTPQLSPTAIAMLPFIADIRVEAPGTAKANQTAELIGQFTFCDTDTAPTAGFSALNTPDSLEVVFTSTSDLVGASQATYSWDFGDGNVLTSSDQNPTHDYSLSGAGTYSVSLTVITCAGTDTITQDVFVCGSGAPVASFTFVEGGTPFDFSFTDTSDLAGAPAATYLWSFDQGAATSTLQDPTHTFVTEGIHTVDLTVTTCRGSDTASTSIEISTCDGTAGPVADFTFVATPGTLDVQFTNTSDLMGATAATYEWSFDGGPVTSMLPSPLITFSTAGQHTATLTVTTCAGSDPVTKAVEVSSVPALSGVSPVDAWIFGGVTATISGTNLTVDTKTGETVTFGTASAEIVEVTDTQVVVRVPSIGETATNQTVDVVYTRSDGATATLAGSFTYVKREAGSNGNTTAGILTGGAGTVAVADAGASITFDGATVKPGNDRFVLVRASTDATTFGLNQLSGATYGTSLAGATQYDIHVYEDAGVTTVTAGTLLLTEVAKESTGTGTIEANVPAGQVTATDVANATVVLFGIDTDDSYNPVTGDSTDSFVATTLPATNQQAAAYQSVVKATGTTDRLSATVKHLSSFILKKGVTLDLSQYDIELDPAQYPNGLATGPSGGGTPVDIVSEEGGLDAIGEVGFGGTKQSSRVVPQPGRTDTRIVVISPAGTAGSTVDLSIYLKSNLNTPALVLPNAFKYNAGTGNGFPITLLLAGLVVLLGLAAGGSSGGGGGGPCFIATAAYDTPMAAELDTLRAVRDGYMLNNPVGTAFVDFYYRVSPAVADVVAQSPLLAALVRIALMPVLFLSKVITTMPQVGLALALLAAALTLLRMRKRAAK